MKLHIAVGIIVTLCTSKSFAQTPPSNDDCANASEVYLGTTLFTNIDATTDGQIHTECQSDGQTYDDVWFNFTAGATGTLVVSTCNTVDYDSDIVVYLGDDCGSLVFLECNDDGTGCSGWSSYLETPVYFGERITIRVGSYGTTTAPGSGTLLLNIVDSVGNPLPSPENDNCIDAVPISEGDTHFTTDEATTDGPAHPKCEVASDGGVTGNDIWYTFTPSASGLLTISTCDQANYDTDLVIYDSSNCGALSFLACNDDGVGCTLFSSLLEVAVTGGVEHLIRVGGFEEGNSGTGTLSLSLVTSPIWVGTDGGSWFNGANWSSGTVPSSASNVTIGGSVVIDQPTALASNVTIQNGGHLQVGSGSSIIGSLDSTLITVQSGGTLQLQNSGSSVTATDISIEAGGILNWFAGTIDISGGTLSSTSNISMGLYDTCTLQADFGVIEANMFTIGPFGSMHGTSWSYVDSFVNHGTIYADGSYSYTKIYGDYTQSSTGTLVTNFTSNASNTWLIVDNNSTISGTGISTIEGTVRLVSNGGYTPTDFTTFDVLKNYEGLHSGAFDTIEVVNFAGGVSFSQSNNVSGVTVTANVIPVHYVDADNTSGDGTSWATAFPTVQEALSAASVGDQIWIAEGTYTPGYSRLSTFTPMTFVTMYGGFIGSENAIEQRDIPAHPTILSGDIGVQNDVTDNVYHVVTCPSFAIVSLDGIIVTAGNANGSGADQSIGAGIFQTTGWLTLTNCTMIDNFALGNGGGVYSNGGWSSYNNCTIDNNEARSGGGIYTLNADLAIDQTTLTSNRARATTIGVSSGGGLYVDGGSLTITDATFQDNIARTDMFVGGHGGAIYATQTDILMSGIDFDTNHASSGGAVYFNDIGATVALIHHCTFEGNYVFQSFGQTPSGAAAFKQIGSSNTEIVNCLFAGNNGAEEPIIDIGTFGNLDNRLTNCTIAHNTNLGTSGAFEGEARLENCIIWHNEGMYGRDWPNQIGGSGVSSIARCLIENFGSGGLLIDKDPLFVSPRGPDGIYGTGDEDYRLFPGSPIIDWGSDTLWDYSVASVPQVDLDGNNRFVDDPYTADANAPSTIDLGCYEFQIQSIGVSGFRSWVNLDTMLSDFTDDFNWEPAEAPTANDTVVILESLGPISFSGNASIDRAIYGSGVTDLELNFNTLSIGSANDSLRIGHFEDMLYSTCELGILNGTVIADRVDISGVGNGGMYFENGTVQASNGFILRNNGAMYGLGTIQGNVYNCGTHQIDLVNKSFPSVTGDYFMTENSIAGLEGSGDIIYFMYDYSGTGDLTSISVGGATTLGGVLQLHGTQNILNAGESATILSSDGGISGNFDSILAMGFGADEIPIVSTVANAVGGESVIVTMQSVNGLLNFDTPDPTNINGLPEDVELEDIDGDGFPDIIMSVPDTNDSASDTDDIIVIYNGGMTGSVWNGFSGGSLLVEVGNKPAGLTVGDFDNDGDMDIAVVNTLDDTVSLCENQTNARSIVSFTVTHAATDYYASDPATLVASPTDVAHASFSGTADIDLAIANSGDGKMVIIEGPLFNLAFRPMSGSSHQTTGGAKTIDPGDVNNDKGFGVVVTGGGGESNIFKQQPARVTEWDPPIVLAMGSGVSEQLVEDLDLNGKNDIILCNQTANTISIALQKTDGTYGTPALLELDAPLSGWYESPRSLSVIDVDDDGDLDLAVVATNQNGNTVTVLFRNDSPVGGELAIFTDFGHEEGSGINPLKTRSADVDNDGFDDLIMVTDTVAFRSNNAVGSTQTVVNSHAPPTPCPGDFNGDGAVNVADLLVLMAAWGPGNGDEDINGDGSVNVADLLILMGAWGACP